MRSQAIEQALDLYFLDESGFAPTLPVSYTWARIGTRAVVPRLAYRSRTGKLDSAAFVEFLWRDVAELPTPPEELPALYRRARPCVIVLDSYSVHRSAVVKALIPVLETVGVTFFYLPPYAPELNAIEPLWRHIKYEDLPVRSFSAAEALKAAVDGVLDDHVQRVAQSRISLCAAA